MQPVLCNRFATKVKLAHLYTRITIKQTHKFQKLQIQGNKLLPQPQNGIKRQQRIKAAGGESGSPLTMSTQEAREILRVSPTASFEEVMRAKENLVAELQSSTDNDLKLQVETAYDVLLMESMKARLSGQSSVSDSIKFADVKKPPSPTKVLNQTLQKLPFQIQTQDQQQTLILGGIYSVLAAWALLQAVSEPPAAAQQDAAGVQLALAGAVGVYWLREKKRVPSLPRALGITASGIILGVLLGALLESWLRVDIVPLGNFSSPGVLIAEFGILGAWVATAFLA
eukprot:TRINITY_DN4269_c0_g2_i1.p1 TRINITY_DN4269_c0_g2~~TRINITY_DN4269_c0_g2_i1.p1  ORF type:complete len:284 (-),score=36.52 TRINITY_DN4269_c0_g2_i1:152-1003(-)